MEPSNSTINNNPPATSPNFQQPTNSLPEIQDIGTVPMSENLQQPSTASQGYATNGPIEQSMVSIPNHIVVMTRECLALGIITLIGTVLGLGMFLFGQEKVTAS